MYKEAIRPAWVEVNLSNLDYNIKSIAKKANGRQLIGVVKADAYGHGAVRVAEVLRANGVQIFAVATLQEAVTLREAGAQEEIIVLGLTPDLYADVVVKYDITAVCCSSQNAKALSAAAVAAGKTVSLLIAVDTGMGRIGYQADDPQTAIADLKIIQTLPGVQLRGMFSHMSTADCRDKAYSKFQEYQYNGFYEAVTAAGIALPFRTFANSASIMEIPSIRFDAVRPGVILYGCYPSDEVDPAELDIRPVMSVKASIVHLKEVGVGFSVGYGRKFVSDRPSKIATLALGYADGYPRPYSAAAKVLVNGVVCSLAGNICMDQCMVDVTDVPDVTVGDEVIILGSDGKNAVTAEDIAKATGTINYEILCAFGQRLPKVYVK